MNDDIIYETLHNEFNIEKHNEIFIHYFEAIITPEGVVEYAVPSHREKLKEKLFELGYSETDFSNMLFEGLPCVANTSGCIVCWWNRFVGTPNEKQRETIDELIKHKVVDNINYLRLLNINRPIKIGQYIKSINGGNDYGY